MYVRLETAPLVIQHVNYVDAVPVRWVCYEPLDEVFDRLGHRFLCAFVLSIGGMATFNGRAGSLARCTVREFQDFPHILAEGAWDHGFVQSCWCRCVS